MTLQDFEDELDRHGADLGRWPVASRTDAEALLRRSPEAQAALAAMQRIERGLRSFAGTLETQGGIASRAMQSRQVDVRRAGLQRAAWGALAAAVLLVGILVGHFDAGRFAPIGTGTTFAAADDSADQLVSAALDPSDTIDVD